MPPDTGRHHGVVRAKVGGVYEIELGPDQVVEARLRGRLKQNRRAEGVVAGDRVVIRCVGDDAFAIEEVEPRRSALTRRAPGRRGPGRPKAIVANVDQVVPVLAAAHPDPNLRMLDRLLVLAESSELPSFIVVNKLDLAEPAEVRRRFAAYAAAGYDVLLTSAATGAGVDALRRRLCGRTSVLTGPSGVGKSSLLNAMEPGLELRTGAVSEAVDKGRHTTVAARLIPLACGGYVADTPGLREVGLWGVPAEALDRCFPEFRPVLGQCRFGRGCSHTHEPDCAVREAVAAGRISAPRYDSYTAMLEVGAAEAETGW